VTTETQSTYEKLTSVALFLLTAALGWIPFAVAAWRAPYIDRPFLLISLAIGIPAVALIYDAAEHLFSRGRGVYTAAVFFSIPAIGIVVCDPGLIPIEMLMLMVAGSTWFAIRAVGTQRPFLLSMLAGLLLISGYGFQLFPGAIALVFPIWFASSRSRRRITLALMLAVSYGVGAALRQIGGLALPSMQLPEGFNALVTGMTLSPWRFYLLPVLILLVVAPRRLQAWQIAATITMIVSMMASAVVGTGLTATAIVISPVLALLAAGLSIESFVPDLPAARKWPYAIAPLVTAGTIGAYLWLGIAGVGEVPEANLVRIVIGVLVALALIYATVRWQSRLIFALLFASGLWFGSFFWPKVELFSAEAITHTSTAWWIGAVAAVILGWIGFRIYYGRNIPRRALMEGKTRSPEADFRAFNKSSAWSGEAVALSGTANEPYSFAILGDVTGAESPITGRQGGYFAFRNLVTRLKSDSPQFVISLGDLAMSATALSFRRVRQLLRTVPIPMTAIPGNHDVFRGTRYDLRFFESLFGADEHVFRVGSAQFVLLNNAAGAYGEEQFARLEKILRGSDAPHLLVFCHKPVFDPRPNGSYAMERRDHAQRLHELFRDCAVTAVFSGHIHTLVTEEREGVTYIISGGGGSKLSSAEDVHHYLGVEVSSRSLTVRAMPVEALEVPAGGLLELHFSPRSCSSAAREIPESRNAS
jgi:predicted phosphodiesterase